MTDRAGIGDLLTSAAAMLTAPSSATPRAGGRTLVSSPATALIWMISGSMASRMPSSFGLRMRTHASPSIDTDRRSEGPGVLAILTARDAAADGLRPLRPTVEANVQTNEPFRFLPQPLLAEDIVRYAGEPIALIIAETRNQALDAAERIVIDFEPLPAVIGAGDALAAEAPLLAGDVPGNVCLDWHWGQTAEVADALKTAPHVVTIELNNHRIVTNPMEPRGAVGHYDGRYTLHLSSQNIHGNRDIAARALGVDPSAVRFIAPDVGGGFGAKNFAYAEHALILWAARRTGRPVKWIATRSETFLSDHQARDHLATASLALDAEGKFRALQVDSIANLGAYMAGGSGGVQTNQYPHLQGSVYAIPAIALRVRAVLTNTTPIGVTRGPGFAEAINIIERLIDAAARQCGFRSYRSAPAQLCRHHPDDQRAEVHSGQRRLPHPLRCRDRQCRPGRFSGTPA